MMMHISQRKTNNIEMFLFTRALSLSFAIRWKIAGNIPGVELRLSDKRLFYIINHIQSIPFPETKQSINDISELEAEVRLGNFDENKGMKCCLFSQQLLNHCWGLRNKLMKQWKK